jgi:hypothetical protein
VPRPLPDKPLTLADAFLTLRSPVPLLPKARKAEPGADSIFSSIKEWAGRDEGVEVVLSFFQIKNSQSLDLGGWVAAYGKSLEQEGFVNLSPNVEQIKMGTVQGRRIIAKADSAAGVAHIQVILLSKGQRCWAIQVRTPSEASYEGMQEGIFKSIKTIE